MKINKIAVIALLIISLLATIVTSQKYKPDKLTFNFKDENTSISFYAELDGQIIPVPYEQFFNEFNKFGFKTNENLITRNLTAQGKTFNNKLYYKIDSSEEYLSNPLNPFMLERNLTGQTKQIKNEIGQTETRQLKRILDFSDIFGKDINLFVTSIQEINESFCVLSSGEDCIEYDYRLVNKTIKTERDISYSFIKQGKNWIIEFFNIFDLDPSFIDDTDTNWNAGTLRGFRVLGTGGSANLSSNNNSGHFASQVFDSNNANAN
ncbi:MAG: hypothetical protein AABX33_06490 [Nanoarchaeota archaeon]